MLVLSRKLQQSICIGDDVKIVVLELSKGQVRIGIEAPKTIPIHRQEVYERIQRQQAHALEKLEE
ncbi:MAG: carbon storage regulator CsrA [Gammaproteobacteria bacterium]